MVRTYCACLLAIVGLAASGCAILGGSDEHVYGRSSLGEAAERARPDTTKLRNDQAKARKEPLDVGWTVPKDEPSTTTSLDVTEDGQPHEGQSLSSGASGAGLVLGLVAGGGSLGGTSYDGYQMFGIDFGGYISPRWRADLIGLGGGINFSGQSVGGQSFTNETELALDLTTRYYISPPHTFMSAYPLVGVRVGTMFWDFDKPITVYENGYPKTVESDQVNFLSFYGGVGTAFVQIRHLHVGMNVTAGIKIYSWYTQEGFSNDLFPAAGFFQGMLETTYKF